MDPIGRRRGPSIRDVRTRSCRRFLPRTSEKELPILIGCRRKVIIVLESGMPPTPRHGRSTSPLLVFGERVRTRRIELDLSQEALGEVAGLHRTYIGGIERGERNLSVVNVVRLAHALGIDPGELLRAL